MTLKIGQIDYLNCVPIFTELKRNIDCSGYEFVRGVPAELNSMLSHGEIDLCPSSSIAYGASPELYYLFPELSISSFGAVKSVFLFSRIPIEELDGKEIGLTADSATSVALLKILLAKRYGFRNIFVRSMLRSLDYAEQPALLLIGDAALAEAARSTKFFVYDLGRLWEEFTNLPFVFALWILRRDAYRRCPDDVKRLAGDLVRAKRSAYESYERIAAETVRQEDINGLVDYWRTISYDLTPRHMEGVRMFFSMAAELAIIPAAPELAFIPEG